MMPERSKLVKMRIVNLGCVGLDGLEIALDDIICIVGANNCGKSTVLRAYELAVGNVPFSADRDLYAKAGDEPAVVEIWVHIPTGTGNIAEKWKTQEGDLLLVRSKWEWHKDTQWKKVRSTWDPELGEYSADGKAAGLDTVFASRLPVPFRIGSLEDPQQEHNKLLTLIVQPIADKLQTLMADDKSELQKALSDLTAQAKKPVDDEQQNLSDIKTELNTSHNRIFPDLLIDFQIGIGEIPINPLQMLLKNSYVKFQEWQNEVLWSQQGTGSQRALFWTMLQVRSRLAAIVNIQEQTEKAVGDMQKKIKKLQGEADKAKKAETKAAKNQEIEDLKQQIEGLKTLDATAQLHAQQKEIPLPGYMLIIDEPEIGLHPNAIRAASQYLYGLAEDPSWQVMLATHAPAFIDPLQDHTTIIRLDRSQKHPSPKTYRSHSIGFSPDEKENLKMLNRFDQGLAEMFFGQYPIIIEGDTEFAAFESLIARHPQVFPLSKKPVLIRARGKGTMLLIIRMLKEFKVPFAILHDADYPTRRDGKTNGAWTLNNAIYDEISDARAQGIHVVHRMSLPNIELVHLAVQYEGEWVRMEDDKDKPWRVFNAIQADEKVENSLLGVFRELADPCSNDVPFDEPFEDGVKVRLLAWAEQHAPKDPRFVFKVT